VLGFSSVSRGLTLFLLLCGAAASAQPPPTSAPPNERAFRELIDGTGRAIRVPARVERIVSLAPSMTETVFALGLQARLAGVTDHCDYPPEALSLPRVGGGLTPSLERIVELKPDLVLATTLLNRRETVNSLDRLGVPVFAAQDPQTVDDVLLEIAAVAGALGASEQGAALVAEMRGRLDALEQALAGRAPRRVLFIVWHDPLITIGRSTFIADALRRAGGLSVIDVEPDWPRISLEEVTRLDPEVLVFASSHSEAVRQTFESLATRPAWQGLAAVKLRQYAVISDAVNRPAPRLLEAIADLARQLHPAAFASSAEKTSGPSGRKPENGRAMPGEKR
jgi:iron complex transport system substrate-binding protein